MIEENRWLIFRAKEDWVEDWEMPILEKKKIYKSNIQYWLKKGGPSYMGKILIFWENLPEHDSLSFL